MATSNVVEERTYALGYFDTEGNYYDYATGPQRVYPFAGFMCDEDGFHVAVKDQYGDWVNPHLMHIGVKSKVKIETRTEAA